MQYNSDNMYSLDFVAYASESRIDNYQNKILNMIASIFVLII